MLSVKKLSDTFQVPATFDFHKLTGSHFGVHWSEDEFNVKIRFNQAVADYINERQWHPDQRIEENPDGSVVLSLTVNHLLELKRWILSWGSMAQILEPQSFVDDIKQTIDDMMGKYYNKPRIT
jgi:predicted DNA-binding transcriptional regulator YafY